MRLVRFFSFRHRQAAEKVDATQVVNCNPNGIASYSPRLAYWATLGQILPDPTATGLRLAIRMMNNRTWREGTVATTPSGLSSTIDCAFARHHPQGSRVPQPWAERCNPFGVPQPQTAPRVAAKNVPRYRNQIISKPNASWITICSTAAYDANPAKA